MFDSDVASLGATGWLEDTSKVAKYVMSEQDYDSRDNTFRKYAAAMRAQDPSWTLAKEMAQRRGVCCTATFPTLSSAFSTCLPACLPARVASGCTTVEELLRAKLNQIELYSHPRAAALHAGLPYTPPQEVGPDYQQEEAAALSVGQRCCVEPGERRGEIRCGVGFGGVGCEPLLCTTIVCTISMPGKVELPPAAPA